MTDGIVFKVRVPSLAVVDTPEDFALLYALFTSGSVENLFLIWGGKVANRPTLAVSVRRPNEADMSQKVLSETTAVCCMPRLSYDVYVQGSSFL